MGYPPCNNANDLKSLGQEILQTATQSLCKFISGEFDAWQRIDDMYHISFNPDVNPPNENDIEQYMNNMYGYIPSAFESYGYPDPGVCTPIATTLLGVASTLLGDKNGQMKLQATDNTGMPAPVPITCPTSIPFIRVGTMRNHLAHWNGKAYENFLDAFVTQIAPPAGGGVIKNHGALAGWLALVLNAYQSIRTSAIKDACDIGQKTLDALDQLHQKDAKEVAATLSVVGAVGAVATAAAPVSAALAVLGLIKDILTDSTSSKPKPTIGGPTVVAVLGSMEIALDQLASKIAEQERQLVAALNTIKTNVDQLSTTDGNRPSQMDIPAPNDVTSLQDARLSDLNNPSNLESFYPNSNGG